MRRTNDVRRFLSVAALCWVLTPAYAQTVIPRHNYGALLEPADAQVERSYRMFITELAPKQDSSSPGVGISMRLQIGIPVFVAPSKSLPTKSLDYVDTKRVGDNYFMQFTNNGNTNVKVTEVGFTPSGATEPVTSPAVVYFLAGQSGLLPVAIPEGEQKGTVTVVTDSLGSLEYELPFAP